MRQDAVILGPATLTRSAATTAIARLRGARNGDNLSLYLEEVFRLAPEMGIDPAVVVAQGALETADWGARNPDAPGAVAWRLRCNPASTGITSRGEGQPDHDLMLRWEDGAQAARAHLAHLAAYAGVPVSPAMRALNPRVDVVVASGWFGSCRTVQDLSMRYAMVPDYGARVARRFNDLFGGAEGGEAVPELNMARGLIPLDFVEDDILKVWEYRTPDRGYDWLGDRPDPPRFLVIHRAQMPEQGTLGTPNGYFTGNVPALTDLECNCITGRMRRFVIRGSAPSGHANGRVSAPYGDALAYLNLTGWDLNAVNRDGEACEITGWFVQPEEESRESVLTDAAKAALARWIASRAHDYGISHADFPLVPSEGGRSYVTWHEEWTAGTGKRCPGPTVKAATPEIIERARSIMKVAQLSRPTESVQPARYPDPVIPDFVLEDKAAGGPRDHVYNGIKIWAARRQYAATKNTRRLRVAETGRSAAVIGPSVKKGETFEGWYVFRSGGQTFVLTPWYSRIQTSGLEPKIRIG